jgi:hypothetical protein
MPRKTENKLTEAKDRADAVKKILANVEKKMQGKTARATLGDYIKLLQLQKELGDEPATELKVTWVEPKEPSSEN